MAKGREESDGRVVPEGRRKAVQTAEGARGGKATTASEMANQLRLFSETADSPQGAVPGAGTGRPETHALYAVPKSKNTTRELREPLRRICRWAGLRMVAWHVLRHTFCSHLAMRGGAPAAIQALAGHESVSTTQRYVHLAPIALKETVKLLEQPAPVGERNLVTAP